MTPRLPNHYALAPDVLKATMAVEAAIIASGLDLRLLKLVKLRASQINGCAYCIHMHVNEARKLGEDEMRLHMLPAWRESSLYSARERAALAWTEALTRVADTGAPDADYALVEAEFDPRERVHLTYAIGAINLWNRLSVGMRNAHPVEKVAHAA